MKSRFARHCVTILGILGAVAITLLCVRNAIAYPEPPPCIPPSIITQPTSQTACVGYSAQYSVYATGTGLGFQWQVKANGSSQWQDAPGYSTGSTYTTPVVVEGDSGKQYQVRVTGTCGGPFFSTSTATLTVTAPATITQQPTAQNVCLGYAAQFSVGTSGNVLGYKWEESYDSGYSWHTAPGNHSSASYLTPVITGMTYNNYRVIITRSCGAELPSSAARLTVFQAPIISSQTYSLPRTVIVSGAGRDYFDGTYYWNETDQAYQIEGFTMEGEIDYQIKQPIPNYWYLADLSSGEVQYYNSVLIGSGWNVSPQGTAPAPVMSYGSTVGVCMGSAVVLGVNVTGYVTSYQWQESDNGTDWSPAPGIVTGSSYTTPPATVAANGKQYRVVVTGPCGSQFSIPTTVKVNTPSITSQPDNQTITYGATATSFSVTATGDDLRYQWRKNGVDLPYENSSELNFFHPSVAESGNYDVIVTSRGCSVASRVAVLTVNRKVLTVTADSQEREYGQGNLPFAHQYSGFVFGEGSQSALTGAPVLGSVANSGSSVSGSPYPIVVVQGNLAAANYSFAFVNGAITVTKPAEPLEVTAHDKRKLAGDPNPPFTGSITGIKNDDPITATYTVSGVGTSPIVPTLIDPLNRLANYDISINNGVFTVDPPIVTINPPAGGVMTYMLGRPPMPIDSGVTISGDFASGFNGKKFKASFKTSREKDYLSVRNLIKNEKTLSDNFNRTDNNNLGASWMEVHGNQSIAGNRLSLQSGGQANNLCINSREHCATANQYVRVTIPTAATGGSNPNPYPYVVFRYTANTGNSSSHYRVVFQITEDLVKWFYHANSSDAGTEVASASLVCDAGNTFGITLTGSGNNTEFRIWKNPSENTPISATAWDTGVNPNVFFDQNPTTPVNSGYLVGLGGKIGLAGNVTFDNLFAGDVPVPGAAKEVIVSSVINGDGTRNISYDGDVIGTCKGGTPTDPLIVEFDASATQAGVEAVLRNFSLANTSASPTEGTREIEAGFYIQSGQTDVPESALWNITGNGVCPGPNAIDVVIILDKTTSMDDSNSDDVPGSPGMTRLQAAKDAAKSFLDYLQFPTAGTSDRAEIMSFNGGPGTSSNPTRNTGFISVKTTLQTEIQNLTTASWTIYHPSLMAARADLAAIADPQRLQLVVFLTDGEIVSVNDNDDDNALFRTYAEEEAQRLKQQNIRLITIGIGGAIQGTLQNPTPPSQALLRAMASSPEDFWMPTVDEPLTELYGRVANAVCRESDANNQPELTEVLKLTGAVKNTPVTITYDYLAANADEYDADVEDIIKFKIKTVNSGTLTLTKGGAAVIPGVTLLGPTESLVWTPATDQYGDLNGFSIRANDGKVDSATDKAVVIFVPEYVNNPPTVNAGTDKMAEVNTPIALVGTVTDDGHEKTTPERRWTQVGGPTQALWSGDETALSTPIFLQQPGTYTFRLTADDGEFRRSDEVLVRVNQAPIVDAGPDRVLTTQSDLSAKLSGTVNDDNLPSGHGDVIITWSGDSGNPSGNVVLVHDPASPNSTLSDRAKYVALFGLGNNLIPANAHYSGGDYGFSGLIPGERYYYTEDTNDGPIDLQNGTEVLLESGYFTAQSDTVHITGEANAPVTAKIQRVSNVPSGKYVFNLVAFDGLNSVSDEMTVTIADLSNRTFTRNVDFAEGSLVNLTYKKIANQLQIPDSPTPFPFINVACSARGTVVRIDAETGQIMGEYRTAPNTVYPNPSRTTVDRFGNVWVANRNDDQYVDVRGVLVKKGSVTKIGLILGGTRCNADKSDNPDGEYLKPPYKYNTCDDRDGDGLIRTSRGRGDIIAWPGSQIDGVPFGADEAILHYVRVASTGTRTVAIDRNNNIWVGGAFVAGAGAENGKHQMIDGNSGEPNEFTIFDTWVDGNLAGGYGGLVDRNGFLWSSYPGNFGLIRFDPTERFSTFPPTSDAHVKNASYSGVGKRANYGLSIDPRNGNVWASANHVDGEGKSVFEFLPDGSLGRSYLHGENPSPVGQGIVVSDGGDIWIGRGGAGGPGGVHHLYAGLTGDIRFVGLITNPCLQQVTGVTIDHRGHVWGTDFLKNLAIRINPNLGPLVDINPDPAVVEERRVGEVDLTVDLGLGAGPYNYSDMSGYVTLGSTIPSGTWTVVYDGSPGGAVSPTWTKVAWTREHQLNAGTVSIEVRAANSRELLESAHFAAVVGLDTDPAPVQIAPTQTDTGGTRFVKSLPNNITGRFIEIRATLERGPAPENVSPILKDLTITSSASAPVVAENNYTLVQDDRKIIPRNSVDNEIDVLANDTPLPNTSLIIESVSAPERGSVKPNTLNTKLLYTPHGNAFGEDSFTYTVTDGQGGRDRATVYVHIKTDGPTFNPPIARDDLVSVAMDSHDNVLFDTVPLNAIPAVTDNDTDPRGDTLRVVELSRPVRGTASFRCDEIRYTPEPGFIGEEHITYTVENGSNQQATATIIITVLPPPTLSCDTSLNDVLNLNSPRVVRTGVPAGDGIYPTSKYKIIGANQEVRISTFGHVGLILRDSVGAIIGADFQSIDANFEANITHLGNGFGRVASVKIDPLGYGYVIGGLFYQVAGVSRLNLARISLSGILDPAFAQTDGEVTCVAVQSDGEILIGGSFNNVTDSTGVVHSRARLARLHSDGTVDTSFNPPVIDGKVNCIVTYYSSSEQEQVCVVGGQFTTVGGSSHPYLARFGNTGALDPSFSASPDGFVTSLATYEDPSYAYLNQILIGGWFGEIDGQSISQLGRVNDEGALDATFNPAPNGTVESLCVYRDNLNALHIILGGDFNQVGGLARSRLARVDAGGNLDASFNPAPNDTVFTIETYLNYGNQRKILFGGQFTSLGATPRGFLAQLNESGDVDPYFQPQIDDIVYSLTTPDQQNKRSVVGGVFTIVNGQSRSAIARLNLSGNGYPQHTSAIRATLATGQEYLLEVTSGNPGFNDHITGQFGYGSTPYNLALQCGEASSPKVGVYWGQTKLPSLSTLDVGVGDVGHLPTASVTIRNEGVADLTLEGGLYVMPPYTVSSGNCALVNGGDLVIPPGESCEINIGMQSPLDAGIREGEVSFESNDPDQPNYTLNLRARINPSGIPPTITLTSPVNGVVLSDPVDLVIETTGITADGDGPVQVEFYRHTGSEYALFPHSAAHPNPTVAVAGKASYKWDNVSVGTHSVAVVAKDTADRFTVVTAQFIVRDPLDNQPPVAVDDRRTVRTDSANNKIYALLNDSDPDGDPITVLEYEQPQNGDVVWDGTYFSYTPPPGAYGQDRFVYTVHDGKGGTATGVVRIEVDGSSPPVISAFTATPPGILSDAWPAPPPIVLAATVTDDQGIRYVEFVAGGVSLGRDITAAGNQYSYSWNDYPSGKHVVEVVAVDTHGNVAYSDPITITVQPPPGNHPPIALIANLQDEVQSDGTISPARIQEGVFTLEGTATDSILDSGNSIRHKVNVYNLQQILVYSTGWIGGEVTDGNLGEGELDFTTLNNGTYDLELVVQDGTGSSGSFRAFEQTKAAVRFVLNTELQIGRLTFSQEDVTIQVNGLPVTVTRTYDSWNKDKGELGFAWTIGLYDMQVELNEFRSEVVDEFGDEFSMREGGGRDVTLTLPDGRRTTFIYHTRDASYDGVSGLEAYWEAEPGVDAKLTTLHPAVPNEGQYGDNSIITALADLNKHAKPYWYGDGGMPPVPLECHDIPGFILTLEDGTEYHITRGEGEERAVLRGGEPFSPITYGPPKVTKVKEPEGNYTTIEGDKITSWKANGEPITSIVFQRDDQERIIEVYAPGSLTGGVISGPPTLRYEYDNDHLKYVHKLTRRDTVNTPPNHSYESLTYIYDDDRPGNEHLITRVEDARGVPSIQYQYDPQGRLTGVVDGKNQRTTVDRAIIAAPYTQKMQDILDLAPTAKRMETATDEWNNETIEAQDSYGNVVYQEDAFGRKTVSLYGTIQPGEVPDERNRTQIRRKDTRDANGILIFRTETDYEYHGEPYSGIVSKITTRQVYVGSPAQPDLVTTTTFDNRGQMLISIDASGKATENTYLADDHEFAPSALYKTEMYHDNGTPEDTTDDLRQVLNENEYYNSEFGEKFKGLLKAIEDGVGNKTVMTYYDGTEPESGGVWGRKKTQEQQDANDVILSHVEYTYDADGNVLTESLARNSESDLLITRMTYDDAGRVIDGFDPRLESDPERLNNHTVYGDSGLVESKTDRYNNPTTYRYDETGTLLETTHADNSIVRSLEIEGYPIGDNRLGRAVIEEMPHYVGDNVLGKRTVYDEVGQEIRSEQLENIKIKITPDGEAYKAEFDAASARVLSTTYNTYDGVGRLQSTTDAEGNVTEFGYDGYGRRDRVKSWTGTGATRKRHQVDTEFNALGSPLFAEITVTPVDADDVYTSGDIETVETPIYHYDKLGRRWLTEYQDGTFTRNIFDGLGRIVEKVDQEGVSTGYLFDGAGRLLAVTNAFKVYLPDTLADLDPNGNPDIPDLNQAENTDGNLPTDRPADHTVTRYKYNLMGSLVEQTDANQSVLGSPQKTIFTYDELGRRTSRILPVGGAASTETWDYDDDVAEGTWPQKVKHTDFNDTVVLTQFDQVGRLVKRTPVSTPANTVPAAGMIETSFAYNAKGQRKTMTDASGLTEYLYDNRGRLWRKTVEKTPANAITANTRTLAYSYDDNNKLKTITSFKSDGTPGPTALTYDYDEQGRLKSAADILNNTTTYTYKPAGSLETVTYPTSVTPADRVVTTYDYNDLHRLTDVTISKQGSPVATFGYNPSDRRLGKTGIRRAAREVMNVAAGSSIQRNVNYDYDRLYRLTAEDITRPGGLTTVPTGTITYDATPGYDTAGYDRVGNRRSRMVSSTSTETTPSLQDKGVTQYSGSTFDLNDRMDSAAFVYEYDANGNTKRGEITPKQDNTADADDLGAVNDQYDTENRLIRRQTATHVYEIVYDGDGNRVRKIKRDLSNVTVIQSEIHYLVDDLNLTGYAQVLEEWESVGGPTLVCAYTYGHDLISQKRGTVTDYYGYDGHGNVRLLLSSAGVVKDAYSYDAFGILVHQWPGGTETPNHYRYCGEQWDADLGMYFLRARYLNQASGAFWSMDSFEGVQSIPASLHKYLYGHGDPVNNLDPSGHSPLTDVLVTMAQKAGLYAYRALDLKKKIDKTFQPWVIMLCSVNIYNVIFNDDIPEVVKAPAIVTTGFYLAEFNKNYKKNSKKTLQRISRLYQWVTDGMGSRKFHSKVETSSSGFPIFTSSLHLYKGGKFEQLVGITIEKIAEEWFGEMSPEYSSVLKGALRIATELRNQTFIVYGGSRSKDYKRANMTTVHGSSDEPPSGATWHHHEVIGIMQLVKKEYHSGNHHKGGVLMYQILRNVDKYP